MTSKAIGFLVSTLAPGIGCWGRVGLLLGLVPFAGALAQVVPTPIPGPVSEPAPPPPPVLRRIAPAGPARGEVGLASALTQYSIGEPTDEEQYLMELVNRARANPTAEGVLLANTTDPAVRDAYNQYQVDLVLMQSQFAALPLAPPLSLHAALITAARLHSLDMLSNVFQGHTSTGGGGLGTRLNAQGYGFSSAGENVYAYGKSAWHTHAGFEVDWGIGPGGMQDGVGHRANLHSLGFREIGIGVVRGTNSNATKTVGPVLTTQDLTDSVTVKPLITGVAYYDLDASGYYGPGEGLGGVRVAVSGATYFAVTANAGGYSVPVPGDGAYTVTFSGANLPTLQQTVTVSARNNVKLDYAPSYQAPVISGTASPVVGHDNAYQVSAVGGATAYQWRQARRLATNLVDGAENGLVNFTAVTTPGYGVIVTDIRAAGTSSFHLAQPQPIPQVLGLNQPFRIGPAGRLDFLSRLGWATKTQVARAQVSLDNGATWRELWSQAGTDGPGDPAFGARSASLAAYAGAEALVRFVYDYTGQLYFPQTDTGVGWYVDGVSLSGVEALTSPVLGDIPADAPFVFRPAAAGDYTLRVRAKVSNRLLDWGPELLVTAVPPVVPTAQTRLTQLRTLAGDQVQLAFVVLSGVANEFGLEAAAGLPEQWVSDAGAVVQSLGGGQYRVTTARSGAKRFYRVQAR